MAGEGSSSASKVYSFNCLTCGSPIPIHAVGLSLTYVCPACSAIVQENHQGLRILAQASQKMQWKPLLELGSRGQFRGETWQVLGFMVRADGTGEYEWSEYLLFNPFQGFRWLTEAQGHWNFLKMSRTQPKPAAGFSGRKQVNWGGRNYQLFLQGQAQVKYVLGEFYWRVKTGDTVLVRDYIAPPDILSSETDADETMWSAGNYVEPQDIEKSFKLLGPLPSPRGVAPNQPSKFLEKRNSYLKAWAVFAGLLVLLQFITGWMRPEKSLLSTVLVRHSSSPNETVNSEIFTIDDNRANIDIHLRASLDNAWVTLKGTLIGDDGQLPEAIRFQRDLVRLQQYDEDGSDLNENSTTVFLSGLQKGRYHLEFQTESGGEGDWVAQIDRQPLTVTVRQNVLPLAPLGLCFFLVSIVPLWLLLRERNFETQRWAESDLGS